MTLEFKSPNQVGDEYLLHLKALKPEINDKQEDSDWYVRSRVVGGVLSGLYSDQRKIADDAFPQSARHEALERHLFVYLDRSFNPATKSVGDVRVTGTTGSFADVGDLQFVYEPNGNSYTNTEAVTLSATAQLVPVQSIGTGQIQNLLEGAELTLSTPPLGFDSTAAVSGGPLSDGRDEESDAEAAAAILDRIRNPLAGGKESDYRQWARDADPSVVAANILRFPSGLGTVGVVISAGTTDIDTALDNDQPIVLTPSDQLIELVADYIETKRPVTDCVQVIKPTEIEIDVTAGVKFSSGSLSTILSGQTKTLEELIAREIKRAIYKTPPGGRQIGASGYVVLAEIEEQVDLIFANTEITVGEIPVLIDRQIDDLSASGANRRILANEIPIPGTITIVEL